jgi:hypothetical protein
MGESIDIVIPAIIDHSNREDELRRYFQAMLQDQTCSFADALDLGCDHRKSNAIFEHVSIDRVSADGHQITIEYQVELSAFNACNLHSDHYLFRRSVVGSQDGDVWKFSKNVPLQERSSVDEL